MSSHTSPHKWSRWTDPEKIFLREHYGTMPAGEIAAALGRPYPGTLEMARRLGLSEGAGKPWTDIERDFLRRHYRNGMSVKAIATRLGRTFGTTVEQAGRLGLRSPNGDVWTSQEDDLLRASYEAGAGNLAAQTGRTKAAVRRRAGRLGVISDAERLRSARRAAIRHDYFSVVDTPLKAYILGWLATDGYITNTIGIRLSEKDAEVVALIRNELAPLHKIATIKGTTKQYHGRLIAGRSAAEFRLISARMKEDLARLGVTPRKSLTLTYPEIPPHLDNSFILGCFEGDGCLHRRRDGRYQWGLYSASEAFLLAIQSHTQDAIGITLRGPYRQGGSSVFKVACQHQERIRELDAWLHADLPGLDRKRLSHRDDSALA